MRRPDADGGGLSRFRHLTFTWLNTRLLKKNAKVDLTSHFALAIRPSAPLALVNIYSAEKSLGTRILYSPPPQSRTHGFLELLYKSI